MSTRRLVLRGHGHPGVRATHAKTLEIATGTDLSDRSTCVVAVVVPGDLDALAGVRGPLTLVLRAGGLEERITAVANHAFAGGSRAVVRRSGRRSPETLAVRAGKGAADLDRDLVRALADPGAVVQIEIELGPGSYDTAELVVVPQGLAQALTGSSGSAGGEQEARLGDLAGAPLMPAGEGVAGIDARLARGEALALLCDLQRPDPAVAVAVRAAVQAGVRVRAVAGVEPSSAALVASGLLGAVRALLGNPPSSSAARGRQFGALATLEVVGVWEGRLAQLTGLLDDLATWRPHAPVHVLADPGGFGETRVAGPAAEVAARVRAGEVATGLGRSGRAAASTPAVAVADLREVAAPGGIDTAVRDVLAALLDEGVTPRTLARALQHVPGVGRREAYDLVVALRGEREPGGDER